MSNTTGYGPNFFRKYIDSILLIHSLILLGYLVLQVQLEITQMIMAITEPTLTQFL